MFDVSALLSGESVAALLKIMVINVVLSGDNAVVIALACRASRRATRSSRSSGAASASWC